MSKPFPGMDPYLEGDRWTTVHTDLCGEIARQLAPKLRPKYVALSTRRVVLAPPDESEMNGAHRFPDVGVLLSRPAAVSSGSAVATAPLILNANLPEPIPQISVTIRDVAQRRLVACIEVLSPTNKRGPGREEYAAKRFELLSGPAHFLEIDLLRGGVRFPTTESLGDVPYFVFLSRADDRKRVVVWPIALAQPLPEVSIPLLPGDPDVQLNLQQALNTIYDIFGYNELLDYTQPPSGVLSDAERVWVEECLCRTGRR